MAAMDMGTAMSSNTQRRFCGIAKFGIDYAIRLVNTTNLLARPTAITLALFAALNVWTQHANAQLADIGATSRNVVIIPRVSISESYTDNVDLSSTARRAEFTTQISPGISIVSNGGRLRGSLDYALTQVLYARNSEKNELQNSLSAAGSYEAIDNWAFVDFSSSISQQSISAFGPQSVDNTSISSNRTEVSNYQLSPYVRGQLANFATYEARYRLSATRSGSELASNVQTNEALVKLSGDRSLGRLSWSADATRQEVDYSAGRPTTSDRVTGRLIYTVGPQLDAIFISGRESNNYVTLEKESHGSTGLGVNWRPSDVTRVSGEFERRYFGDTHTLTVEHRTPRTAWTYSDSKSVQSSTSPTTLTSLGGLYDLLFAQFATLEPDAIKRAQLVRSFLQVNGLDPNTSVVGAYSRSTLSLQRSQILSFAILGIRDTITFTAARSTGQLLGTGAVASSDFANTSVIRQNGLTMSYSHRLTPDSSVNFLVSQQKSAGESQMLQTRLRTFNLSLSTKLSRKMYGSFGARHTISDGNSSPYRENALTGSINFQF